MKCVVFVLDGVIADTSSTMIRCFNSVSRKLCGDAKGLDEMKMKGLPLRFMFENVLSEYKEDYSPSDVDYAVELYKREVEIHFH